MAQLPIEGLQSRDAGRLLVRLNSGYRDGIGRYGIARLNSNTNSKSPLTLVLGHDDKTAIYMPYDIRRTLGVEIGGNLHFSIEKASLFDKLRWYVTAPDPAVHVPTWIALIGIAVGIAGVLVGLF